MHCGARHRDPYASRAVKIDSDVPKEERVMETSICSLSNVHTAQINNFSFGKARVCCADLPCETARTDRRRSACARSTCVRLGLEEHIQNEYKTLRAQAFQTKSISLPIHNDIHNFSCGCARQIFHPKFDRSPASNIRV